MNTERRVAGAPRRDAGTFLPQGAQKKGLVAVPYKHCHKPALPKRWSGRLDLNQRPPASKPTEAKRLRKTPLCAEENTGKIPLPYPINKLAETWPCLSADARAAITALIEQFSAGAGIETRKTEGSG